MCGDSCEVRLSFFLFADLILAAADDSSDAGNA
jgi:hypothetical protein